MSERMTLNPTRANLLLLRKKLETANKGRGILDRKRKALVNEFLALISEPRRRRRELVQILQKGYKATILANAYIGNFELSQMAYFMKESNPVQIEIKNVMGVKVPEISQVRKEQQANEKTPIPFGASLAVDEINGIYTEALQALIDTAELEHGLRVVVLEIEKTKRQINTLDNVVIPKMKNEERYIQMRIDEMERDSFIALKHVKKRLQAE